MTISTTESTAVFNGNGVTTVFPFTFPFIQDSDLKVYQEVVATGVVTEITTGFTKVGAGSNSGGSVDFIAAPASGIKIIVSRELELTQPTDFRNQGSFFPEVHEDAFDRLTMMIQGVGNAGKNAIRIPGYEQGLNTVTPTAATRSNKVLAFDALGNVITSNMTLAEIEAEAELRYSSRFTMKVNATEGQTVITTEFAYVPAANQIAVTVNGLLLTPAEDYVETDSDTVTLSNPLEAGDIVLIEAFSNTSYAVDADNVGFAGGTLADLENTLDPAKGSALVGRSVVVVDGIKDLLNPALSGRTDIVIHVKRYWSGAVSQAGGGWFQWLANPKSNHDGGVRISPTVPWDGLQSAHENFLNGVGETDPSGSGYWLRASSVGTHGRSPIDYGANEVSVVPDSKYIFDKFEVKFPNAEADLYGLQFRVSAFPSGAEYYNGSFRRISDSLIVEAGWSGVQRVGNRNVLLGRETANNLTTLNHEQTGGQGYNLTAVGDKALRSAGNNLKHCTAIGPGAGYSQQYGRYNIYIGLEAGYSCTGDAGDEDIGSRNVVVGDNGARFNQGSHNVVLGRNAMQCNTSGTHNIYIGSAAGGGIGPVGLDGETIQNPFPTTGLYRTAIGTLALNWGYADSSTAYGAQALESLKGGVSNCAIGSRTLRLLESGYSPKGTEISTTGAGSKTWTRSGATVTVTDTAHTLAVGNIVAMTFTSGVPANVIGATQYVTVATTSANSWTFVGSTAMSASGNATRVEQYLNVALTTQDNNTAVGNNAGASMLTGQENTLIGQAAAFSLTSGVANTALGRSALRTLQSGSAATALNNCTGVGYDTRVSGDNQVQIGNSLTTTYVYGTVQNRSDARDKTDLTDTELGLDFVLGLRPVSGRWDMREDYIDVAGDGTVTRHDKDGSRARKRRHQWFVAQEVAELCESLGVDFGGLQHHSVNGGEDVFSLGYDEFIPPVVKAVQECWSKIKDLDARLIALENSQPL